MLGVMNKFVLQSDFAPAGDQPKAIKQLTKNLKQGVKNQVLLGVTGSGKTFTIANVIEKVQRPTLVIAHNKILAAQLVGELRTFFPKNAVEYFVSYYDYYQPEAYLPATDVYIEKDLKINQEIDRLRHAATAALLSRRDVIVVASVSCIYGLGSPEFYRDITFNLKKGTVLDRDQVVTELVRLQYKRSNILQRSQFRLTGSVLEIVRPDRDIVSRIETDREGKIISIYEYNSLTGETASGQLEEILIYPARHFVTSEKMLADAQEKIKAEMEIQVEKFMAQGKIVEAQRIRRRTNYDLEMMREIGYCNGIENYSLYLSGRKKGEAPYTLVDYFPADFLTIIDESHVTIPQVGAMFGGDFSRKKNLVEHGFRLPSAFDNRPLKFFEFEKKLGQTIFMSATPGNYELNQIGKSKENTGGHRALVSNYQKEKTNFLVEQIVRPTGLVDPEIEIRPCSGQIQDVIDRSKEVFERGERILITTLTKKMAEDLAAYLKEDREMKSCYLHSEVDTVERIKILDQLRRGKIDVLVGVNLLREGLDLPEVSLVAILDADKEGFLRSRTSLIQTIGRAARNIRGKVVLYADKITGSMKEAVAETKRRRILQINYNKRHKIVPQTIKKKLQASIEFEEKAEKGFEEEILKLESPVAIKKYIKEREKLMSKFSDNLEFEKAAVIRDEVLALQRALRSIGQHNVHKR